jgi:hypothetical protein
MFWRPCRCPKRLLNVIRREYIFIINLFRDINVNTIYYKFDQTWVSLTGTHPIIASFGGRREHFLGVSATFANFLNFLSQNPEWHTLKDGGSQRKPLFAHSFHSDPFLVPAVSLTYHHSLRPEKWYVLC